MPVDVLVPPLGTNVDVLTLISWYKQEGDVVVKDEPLFVVETDKATLDVEAPASGILCRILAEPGAEVAALSRIASILKPEEIDQASAAPKAPAPSQSKGSPHTVPSRTPEHPNTRIPEPPNPRSTGHPPARIFISPRARQLAESRGLEWRSLTGTGPEGAIVERDIAARLADTRRVVASPLAQRMAESAQIDWTQLTGTGPGGKVVREDIGRVAGNRVDRSDPSDRSDSSDLSDASDARELLESIPITGARAVIAARMSQAARTTAPVTLTAQADATKLVNERARRASEGQKLSYNAYLLQIVAHALREHPRLNASILGDAIKIWRSVHIGLAVDSEHGLRVPVVRDVDRKSLVELEHETRDRAQTARAGSTPPAALRGGTFTITNLGTYGIAAFTPVINLPECAILGVGQIRPEPAVFEGRIEARQKVWLSLTFDHRLVDGAPAARFLQRVVQLIEDPQLLGR
jgi:pyruvate dehydrogenase E2 component (dihydrolipoamide acetyltransferase)